MSGDRDVHGLGHSTESDTVKRLSIEGEDAKLQALCGTPPPFPYDSCAEAAYSDDDDAADTADTADAEESEGPRWLLNALDGLDWNPLRGLGPAIMAGILRAAAADTGGKGGKGGKGGGGKGPKKTAPARAAPRKGGAPLLSKEQWLERILYFKAMGKNWAAFRARFKGDGDIVKRGTFTKYVKEYEEAQAQAPASTSGGNSDWSVLKEHLSRKPGSKP